MANITIELEFLGRDIEVNVDYDFIGTNRAATLYEPAEFEELEINSVTRNRKCGVIELNDMLTDDDWELIKATTQEWLNEEG